jgi:small subunit ribosomal protein S8
MSQDIVTDALNMMKNAALAKKEKIVVTRISNLLIEVLKIMRQEKLVKRYKINTKDKSLEITIGNLTECRAIKPRFTVDKTQIEKYRRRYLPSRNIGNLIISTNKGLLTHIEAQKEGIGGCLIAYFY